MVAQVRPDGLRRVLQHVQLRLAQRAADLPGVTALEAAVDQDAGGVHLLEEVGGHDVALEPDRVQAHGLHQRDLLGRVGRRVVQEQVRVESAAPDDDRHAVDLEGPGAARLDRVGSGQGRGDRPDAERLSGGVVGRGSLSHRRRQRVQRLGAHLVGPPDLRVGDRQGREAGRGERDRLGGVCRHRDALADRDRRPVARRGTLATGTGCLQRFNAPSVREATIRSNTELRCPMERSNTWNQSGDLGSPQTGSLSRLSLHISM